MNKKGLSSIVTILILILLVLVSIGIVWVVIANFIKTGTDQVPGVFDTLNIKLSIDEDSVLLNPDNTVSVTVYRDMGEGSLQKINFVLSDGSNSVVQTLDASDLNELGTKTFRINISKISRLDTISIVSGAGKSGSTAVSSANVADSYTLPTPKLVFGNMDGVIGYYPLESSSSGVSLNGSTYISQGKFGGAVYLNGLNASANLTNDWPDGSSYSMSVWFKANSSGNSKYIIDKSWGWTGFYQYGNSLVFWIYNDSRQYVASASFDVWAVNNITIGDWANAVGTIDNSAKTVKLYFNGNLVSQRGYTGTAWYSGPAITIGDVYLGQPGMFFNGTIDHLMIFNRTLSASEISEMYNQLK